MARRILVTAALPYANGAIHFGHLLENIQADIWVRFQRLRGNEVYYFCADDTHGTPVMIQARQEGISPEQLIQRMHAEHVRDFAGFDIVFDNYHTTHSPENHELTLWFFRQAQAAGRIVTAEVQQLYDPVEKMFLPDRFIRGTCPRCGASEQYGDSCEQCGAHYDPTELKDPVSVVSGARPERKSSKHYFFRVADYTDQLRRWMAAGHVDLQIANKMQEWFDTGLRDWDISRDPPYFGFRMPVEEEKYFYVWFDAPIGYVASCKNFCDGRGLDWRQFWAGEDVEVHHFIGKDIAYFHTLYWPAALLAAGLNMPTRVNTHGFLTVDGEKMSKTRGTFINASTYLQHLDPQYLRYYFACKLSPGIDDIDLSFKDFIARVNADLVGDFANLISRSAQMLHRQLDGRLGRVDSAGRQVLAKLIAAAGQIADDYEHLRYSSAMRTINSLADEVNRYFDAARPWVTVKTDQQATRAVLTTTLNASRILATYLKPVVPRFAAGVEKLLQVDPLNWSALERPVEDRGIGPFERLVERVDPRKIDAVIEQTRSDQDAHARASQPAAEGSASQPAASGRRAGGPADVAPMCTIEDFEKIDLRVARVLVAERVEGADKLLRLEVDLGGGQRRQLLAGIAKAYRPEQLLGRMVVVVANLKPRKMRFGISEGMILAVGDSDEQVFLLGVDDGAAPGQRVR